MGVQQNVAADAVQEGVGPMLSCPLRHSQGLIDTRQRPFCVLSLGFKLCEAT